MNKWYFLIAIPLVRFLININNYLYLRQFEKNHDLFIQGQSPDASDIIKKKSKKATTWINDNQLEIKRRTLNAGAQDQFESYMKPVGLGYGQKETLSALDNLLYLNTDLLLSARSIIKTAKGQYKVQAWLSMSPIFWIEMIIFLPRELLKMAGFKEKSKGQQNTTNIIQMIYWVISIVYMIKLIQK